MTIVVPDRIVNFVKRVAGLSPGRYLAVLDVEKRSLTYSIRRVGSMEEAGGDVDQNLASLPHGRYFAVLTVDGSGVNYTTQRVGKVEK